jgi:DNA-binding NarL/FixJ family response regulator
VRLLAAAERLNTEIGRQVAALEPVAAGRIMRDARRQRGRAAVASDWANGQAMPSEDAIAFALAPDDAEQPAVDPRRPRGTAPAAPLTTREREVAALLARGLSNRAIAAALVISERTAEKHVANVMAKLGLRSRAQVAARSAAQEPSRP